MKSPGRLEDPVTLATKDPAGKATTGITRTATRPTPSVPTTRSSPRRPAASPPWTTNRYLNIWVCNLSSNLLGYAQFPGGPAKTDGVVILFSAFGTSAGDGAFNKGRTATHEIGHYLGLRTSGATATSAAETTSSTPPLKTNTGKPTFPHITCNNGPNGDMFMNYMDYVDDDAMFMFTPGQVARMNATLAGRARSWRAASRGDGRRAR